MTSRSLFFRLLRQDFHKRIWCPLCIFILDFLVLEVYLLLCLDDVIRFKNTYPYAADYYLADIFFANNTISPMLIMTVLSAIVCGIGGFAYLHSRSRIDMYHALPVRRGMLYAAKYTAGVLYYALPLLLHMLLCLGIGAARGAYTMHALKNAIGYMGTSLLIFLAVYSVCVVAVMLTGNLISAIAGAAILLTYSGLLMYLRDNLYYHFYYTNMHKHNSEFPAFSPLHMLSGLLTQTDMQQEYQPYRYISHVDALPPFIIATVIFTALGYFLYRVRPLEAAGKTVIFPVTEPVIKTALCIPVALYSGLFFASSASKSSFLWFVFGVVCGFLLTALLLEIAFRMDIRCVFHHCGQLLFNGACIAMLVVIFKIDALGYNTYIPSDAEIADCSVSIAGLMDTTSCGRNGYVDLTQFCLDNMHISDNPSIMQLARKAAKEGLRYADVDYYDGIEDTPEYQKQMEEESYLRRISFSYHLKNGKSVYRQYYVDIRDEEALNLLCDIYNDTDYKVSAMPLFANGWSNSYNFVSCIGQFHDASIQLTDELQAKLLETYQSEFMSLTLEEIMSSYPVASLTFTGNLVTGRYNGYQISDYDYPVYPAFKRTIGLLREYGFDCEAGDAGDMEIEALTVIDYSHKLADDTYASHVYRDAQQIEELLNAAVASELQNSSIRYMPLDTQYTIYTGDTAASGYYDSYRVYSFKENQVPDFVIKDLSEASK